MIIGLRVRIEGDSGLEEGSHELSNFEVFRMKLVLSGVDLIL